ncbi:type I-U CRISPR-associated protein Cas7 [bacterium]|nr:type I-U CRISPR-associated protein Cas7 [candidate division CSSED10-310 bacterium]
MLLKKTSRVLIQADLEPVQGSRFQPTGFPDLGAGVFERPDGTRMILVESAQSMANRLEKVCLDGDGPEIEENLKGLPYVIVQLHGDVKRDKEEEVLHIDTWTSSLVEAHRLNSPFIITCPEFSKPFVQKMEYAAGKLLDWHKIASAIFAYDPNSLIHGIFFANLGDGRVRLPRALSAFIEAEGIREAVSGGVKNNAFDPTGKIRVSGLEKDVYGNVPYHRTEYTAQRITAYFNLDIGLFRGYHLKTPAYDLLIALSFYKIRKFLEGGLRLRTACDFKVKGDVRVIEPSGYSLPDTDQLTRQLRNAIDACAAGELFADPPVTRLETKVVRKA